MRQKDESQNGCFKKIKHAKVSEKRLFVTHQYAHVKHTYMCVSGSKKSLFFGKFGGLCLLETPVLRFPLLPYYRRFHRSILEKLHGLCYLCSFLNINRWLFPYPESIWKELKCQRV